MKDVVRARYTLEFKQETVRLVRGGEKLSMVARTVGVSAQSLDNWVRGLSSSGTENLHKVGHASSMPAAFGSPSGLSSPSATVSGNVKAYRPSILICLKLSGDSRAAARQLA